MKRLLIIYSVLLALAGCQEPTPDLKKNTPSSKPLITVRYSADPSAHVFNGRLYLYPSHDRNTSQHVSHEGDQYDMEDYYVYSMENIPGQVTDHGLALHLKDIPWASRQLWAPDATYWNGEYLLVFPARDKNDIFRIGVARSDKPHGPFTPDRKPIGKSYSIDPAVFIESDEAYIIVGGLWGGQLEKWHTHQSGQVEFDKNGREPNDDAPALGPRIGKVNNDFTAIDGEFTEIIILDELGAPITAGDHERRFFEGAWIHTYNHRYYLSYSTGNTHYIVYATSDSLFGPYTYQGKILEPVLGWTTHHSIVEFDNKWWLFYHDASLSGGIDHKRSVKVAELKYDTNGHITLRDAD